MATAITWLEPSLAGYQPSLISVIPPGAQLLPSSKIAADQLGKVPGVRYEQGLWGGYDWRKHVATDADIQAWAQAGANIGLRAGSFPGLDIDSLDPEVVRQVRELAVYNLGSTRVRTGKAPKCLLIYRTAEPFTRMRLWLEKDGQTHLVELLGDGQQYLIGGVHPATLRPYEWDSFPEATQLPSIAQHDVARLFRDIQKIFSDQGYTVRHEGDGHKIERSRLANQDELKAPTIERLRQVVGCIPNREPSRDEYIKMGAAIKAAAGELDDEGFEIFSDWAVRWEGGHNAPETVWADWRRLYSPFSVGWMWLLELAREHGYDDSDEVFSVDDMPALSPIDDMPPAPRRVRLTDTWLADEVVRVKGDRLRYLPAQEKWVIWTGQQWKPDAMLLAQREISDVLQEIAQEEIAAAPQGVLSAPLVRRVTQIESAATLSSVMRLVRADRAIAVEPTSLDADPWLLNTPTGVVDLRTGAIAAPLPDQLHTKTTKVGPVPGPMPEWLRFLREATQEDDAVIGYLQALGGYCLTGDTSEQMFAFLWGDGGRGKGTFIHTLREILGDYATMANMDTFVASSGDRHPTELAALMGARLVVAVETQEGRRWDEQKIKSLTGGDPVSARFMRQDLFVYEPRFKLVFLGNYQPAIRTVDEAMRRRVHMVGFMQTPRVKDTLLREKFQPEHPAILAWFLEGCLRWQQEGLRQPPAVQVVTEDYFESQDSIGHWLEEECSLGSGAEELNKLFASWKEWCNANGIKVMGDSRTLRQALLARGLQPVRKHQRTRRTMIGGITLTPSALPWEAASVVR